MAEIVVTGGICTCSFGTRPRQINVTSQMSVLVGGKPAATIMDNGLVNIPPFGMCTSLANPQVAAATAAALGVLTPQPCMMAAAGPWIPTKPTTILGGKPVLTKDCKLICANGMGNISILSPGQFTVAVK